MWYSKTKRNEKMKKYQDKIQALIENIVLKNYYRAKENKDLFISNIMWYESIFYDEAKSRVDQAFKEIKVSK